VIPATSLYVAVLAGADAADFDAHGFTVIPFTAPIVPGVALIARTTGGFVPPDIAHTAWEAQATEYPVLTDNPAAYQHLSVPIDLETL
jgi:hypothetical protein